MSVRACVVDFLQAAVAGAVEGDPLFEAEVNDSPGDAFEKPKGVTVAWNTFRFARNYAQEMKEVDGKMVLLCYALAVTDTPPARSIAYEVAYEIAKGIASKFWDDTSVGGNVCDSLIDFVETGWDAEDGLPYQVVGLVLLYNQVGPVTTR
jgi:hypothetical protein